MMTMEQMKYTSDGRIRTSGPLDYKIPCVRNIPREFKVKLLKDSEGGKAVYSSKVTYCHCKPQKGVQMVFGNNKMK